MMMTFMVTETNFGAYPALEITGATTRVVLTHCGATVLSWTVDGVELIDGYADHSELATQAGMRSAMMIPFSNRIRHGRYRFDGADHDLNGTEAEQAGQTVLHGMLRLAEFSVEAIEAEENFAIVRLNSTALRPGSFAGYPFAVDVSIELTVTDSTLDFLVTGTNVGTVAAPYASGWHPYFTIGDAPIERLIVRIPATTHVVVGADLIPIDGAAAFEPVAGNFDWREARPIGDVVLDGAFEGLVIEADGFSHSTMTDPVSGRTIDAWQERGLMHIFTSDTVTRPRRSFAMESVEFMTNAFARDDHAARIRLEPSQRRSFRFGATTTLETR